MGTSGRSNLKTNTERVFGAQSGLDAGQMQCTGILRTTLVSDTLCGT